MYSQTVRPALRAGVAEAPAACVTVRPARAGEAGRLSLIARRSKAHWGYGSDFIAACERELTLCEADIIRDDVWVSEDVASEPAGFFEAVAADGIFEVVLFFVCPDHIGRGHGGALWRVLERRALAMGCHTIGLDADPYSVGFYRRMGMVVTGEAASHSIPGRMLPRMAKRLAG